MNKNFLIKKNGSTLVELLVSIALFLVVITIVVGGFTRGLKTNRQLLATIAVNSNISFMIEKMSREMRTGSGFQVLNPGEISFANSQGEEITYKLMGKSIYRKVDLNPAQQVTDDSVSVELFTFDIIDFFNLSPYSPRIRLFLGIRPTGASSGVKTIFIQTTVSSRNFLP
ncbi:MAG: type II secretion system protein [Candidatus Paceibacterota bacterium]|jgi:type II secretory pathway pseudopilin PulG